MPKKRSLRSACVLFSTILLGPSVILARQESSSSPPEPESTSGSTIADGQEHPTDESSSRESSARSGPPQPVIRQLGSASALTSVGSPVRWGHLYMAYADYVQAVDRISGFLNQPINQTRNISLFETPIVYDRQFRRSRLGIQYRPRLAFLDGKVIGDFVNQDLSFETYYLLSPRWTLRISDRFQYSSSKSSLAALHLDFDVISGSTVQNAFVDVPSRWFSNSVGGTVSYRWSARTEISFVPQYAYVDTRVESAGNRGNIYSADIDVDHQLSARQSVGLYYTTQFIRLTSNEDSPSVYQGLGGSYRWRIRPSLSFRGSFGALTSTFGGSGSREWTVSSNLRLIKSFRKSSIAVTYVRGDSFTSGYVSDRYNDRVDASFRTTLTKRLDIGFGGGYLRELSRTGISAKYVGSRLTYLLYPNILLVVNYAHKNQSGDGVDVFRGTRDIFSFGLSWQPATPR